MYICGPCSPKHGLIFEKILFYSISCYRIVEKLRETFETYFLNLFVSSNKQK